ncbi:MAG: hypothetical protein M3161_02265 [Actinomycetota bacterium]|nr:hypothetical protein [Actinomycetota bacterium]
MDDRTDVERLRQREDSLTVVQGCLATVLTHWDRLTGHERTQLLEIALDKTHRLIDIYSQDVAALRL